MTTPVVLRASLARSISYLDFEGLIPASRNIYLRFKGLPECGTRSISGCSALESCGSHGVYTRAPTPRNAVRCLSEPQSTPRNEDSPRISRSSFERRMCSTVKHADEQACQRRNDHPSWNCCSGSMLNMASSHGREPPNTVTMLARHVANDTMATSSTIQKYTRGK